MRSDYCQSSVFCRNRLGGAFIGMDGRGILLSQPGGLWVKPDSGSAEEIPRALAFCRSFLLFVVLRGKERRNLVHALDDRIVAFAMDETEADQGLFGDFSA